jgi:hypothetical protein
MKKVILGMRSLDRFLLLTKSAELTLVDSSFALRRMFTLYLIFKMKMFLLSYGLTS